MSEVLAPMEANVYRVEVAVGDTVSPGDVVAVLEAMKMEIPVNAEASGVVTELRVVAGENVAEGAVIAVLADS
ncbi:acetyl-CoA carboxylase biotin carboxyl carrier protein subunit [Kineococcus sp. G2]|uniref:acetyl-CoA carboxylase biotin carboxyl carrier protein subunit n=1 Tax=Kineococcus sp. G2 TaxID=3127484 RepID=UPI00301E589B